MLIKKNTLVKIDSRRKGVYLGYAEKDFNTEDEWYPIILAVFEVQGANTDWTAGDRIPCRGSLCEITVIA